MTDLEKFIDLYKSLGIDLKQNFYESEIVIILSPETSYMGDSSNGYSIEHKHITEHELFEGYGGFFSKISFTIDGKFISQGFYE